MFIITTERLGLLPLSYEQAILFTRSRNDFESRVGLALSQFELNATEGFSAEITESLDNYVIPKLKLHKEHYEWYSHWLIIHLQKKLIIGGIGMNGLPNEAGEVMLGYYIDKKFESQGYTTEALGGLIKWIIKNPNVKSIIADTLTDGYASQKVLKKNGFIYDTLVEEGIRWRLIL